LLVTIVLVAAGVATAGPYGVMLGLAPFIVRRDLTAPSATASSHPDLPRRGASSRASFGWLLAVVAVRAVPLINTGPILVQVLGSEKNDAATGQFLASLVIARIPVFLFQGVQAALLPRLSGHAGAGQVADLRLETRRMTAAIGVLCVAALYRGVGAGPDGRARRLWGRFRPREPGSSRCSRPRRASTCSP